jgi:hypothetical protein
LLIATAVTAITAAAPQKGREFDWRTVANSNDLIPPLFERTFNSYNQPSVNERGVVVFRARSRGGQGLGPPIHGIYLRDMSVPDDDIIRLLDRTTEVPQPNNLGTTFVETPSFPRIDMMSNTVATRGNHPPAYRYLQGDGEETRAGTTGIYTNPYGELVTAASNLGMAPGMSRFRVPEFTDVRFEVFPGAPAVTGGDTIVFKGNYTVDGVAKTGVYFRKIDPSSDGGTAQAVLIANNTDSSIPETSTVFGSTSPPNAAAGNAVFAGFDDEAAPQAGGIYLAPLEWQPPLTTLVSIGQRVPGESVRETFNRLGEGVAFDGRFVAFWGAWGDATRSVRLYCPEEGNKDRIAYCNQALTCADTGEVIGDPDSVCDDSNDPRFGISCYTDRMVWPNQGIFVHDTRTGFAHRVAKTGRGLDELLFWNYSGKTPCVGGGHSSEGAEDDGEPATWRSSAFVAVSVGMGATFNVAFKARKGELVDGVYVDAVDGIYLKRGPGWSPLEIVVDTTMRGREIDAEAPAGSVVTEVGLEREGLRGRWLTVNAAIGVEGGEEEDGIAGIYITPLR